MADLISVIFAVMILVEHEDGWWLEVLHFAAFNMHFLIATNMFFDQRNTF